MASPILIDLQDNLANLDALLAGITHVHASCIEHDHTLATFLPPLSFSKMVQYWHDRVEETKTGGRRIWVELHPVSTRQTQLDSPLQDDQMPPIKLNDFPDEIYEVAGVVALYTPVSETGPFRAEVHKLLVSPNHRRKGIGKRLMAELEKYALKHGRWNLMLDTEIGSPAEQVYPRLGYIRIGEVLQYGYSPLDGRMTDEVWFYKDLRRGTL